MKKLLISIAAIAAISSAAFAGSAIFDEAKSAFNAGDYVKAENLYKKSCDKGDSLGCVNLGIMKSSGVVGPSDQPAAVIYFGKGCTMGDWKGCSNAAIVSLEQNDEKTAGVFLGKSCKLGDSEACDALKKLEEKTHGTN
jgi:hypothetical protein